MSKSNNRRRNRIIGLTQVIFAGALAVLLASPAARAQDDEFDDSWGDDVAEEKAEPIRSPQVQAKLNAHAAPKESQAEAKASASSSASSQGIATQTGTAVGQHEEIYWRKRALRIHNTLQGSTGGFRVVDAGSAPAGMFRAQLAGEFFVIDDYLVAGDRQTHFAGSLSVSWSVLDFLELYGSVMSYANSNNLEDPSVFQVMGDSSLGVKAFYSVLPWLTVGGDVTGLIFNGSNEIGPEWKATSLRAGANLSADFRRLQDNIPLLARLGVHYFLDNSAQYIADTEQARYDALPDAAAASSEDRHLVSRIERFSLQVNRVDRLNIGLGFEAPFEFGDDWALHPIAEIQLDIPINRQGYDCLFVADPASPNEPLAGNDGCLDKQGFSAWPMYTTVGLRFQPAVTGLSIFAGADIGITGVNVFTRELAPVPPYNLIFGLAYAYDAAPPAPVAQPIAVAPKREAGRVEGIVVDEATGAPIENAVVRFPQHGWTPLHTEADGLFVLREVPLVKVPMRVTAEGYAAGQCEGQASAKDVVQTRCALQALPPAGEIHGSVTDEQGNPVVATAKVTGVKSAEAQGNPDGTFRVLQLPPGEYSVTVEADKYFSKVVSVTVLENKASTLSVSLVSRPEETSIQVTKTEIKLKKKIHFATNSAEIVADSAQLLNEIAEAMRLHPEIRLVEIQGHTDSRGGRKLNKTLSENRANSVRDWLINEGGIEASRMVAKGYGMERPLVPNITADNRAKNRRVNFIIQERSEETPEAMSVPSDETSTTPSAQPPPDGGSVSSGKETKTNKQSAEP